jgi:hypothetical protein
LNLSIDFCNGEFIKSSSICGMHDLQNQRKCVMRRVCMSFLSFYIGDCFTSQSGIAPGYGEGIEDV